MRDLGAQREVLQQVDIILVNSDTIPPPRARTHLLDKRRHQQRIVQHNEQRQQRIRYSDPLELHHETPITIK